MPLDDLIEPARYGTGWLWLGTGLLAGVLAWLVVAWFWGRRGPADDRDAASAHPLAGGTAVDPYAGARRVRLAALDRIAAEHRAGTLDDREADLAVGAVLRDFAAVRAAVPARSLTASELRALGYTGGTSELIVELLAPTFSATGPTPDSVAVALDRARTVVARW
ncbi:MAG TPA: hypothetical protein VGC57_14445 [Cellulomonas sp.]